MITEFFNNVYVLISSLTLEASLYICWGAFGFVFLLTLVLTLCNAGVRAADKRPYLALVNMFAVVTFALALTEEELPFSLLLAAVFWCFGYLTYGIIALLSRRRPPRRRPSVPDLPPPAARMRPSSPPAPSNVRVEHALSVTEKLLAKDLGRGDRQEAERIKAAVTFLQAKGDLTPQDNEALNDNFNTLLKLMAKYNV